MISAQRYMEVTLQLGDKREVTLTSVCALSIEDRKLNFGLIFIISEESTTIKSRGRTSHTVWTVLLDTTALGLEM